METKINLDFKAVTKMNRSIPKVDLKIMVCPKILNQVSLKIDHPFATNTDIVNFCLVHFLVDDDVRDLLIKKAKSKDMGKTRGRSSDKDQDWAYRMRDELLERRLVL